MFVISTRIESSNSNCIIVVIMVIIIFIISIITSTCVCDRQLSESQQKVLSLTEQLERKVAANSTDNNTHGSENGPDDTSVLKVSSLFCTFC